MWYFKIDKKAELLKGRKIYYLAENELYISKEYLGAILRGNMGCSIRLAYNILKLISNEARLEDYFYKKGK